MIVINKQPRVHFIDIQVPYTADELEKIKKQELVVPRRESIKLLPGANDIDADLWSKAKDLFLVRYFLEEGILAEKNVAGIDEMKPEQAVRVVEETFDRELLNRWAASEKRAKVSKTIATQIAKISPTPSQKQEV